MTKTEQNALQAAHLYVQQLSCKKPGYIRALMFLVGMDIQTKRKTFQVDCFLHQMVLAELAAHFPSYILHAEFPSADEQAMAAQDWDRFKEYVL